MSIDDQPQEQNDPIESEQKKVESDSKNKKKKKLFQDEDKKKKNLKMQLKKAFKKQAQQKMRDLKKFKLVQVLYLKNDESIENQFIQIAQKIDVNVQSTNYQKMLKTNKRNSKKREQLSIEYQFQDFTKKTIGEKQFRSNTFSFFMIEYRKNFECLFLNECLAQNNQDLKTFLKKYNRKYENILFSFDEYFNYKDGTILAIRLYQKIADDSLRDKKVFVWHTQQLLDTTFYSNFFSTFYYKELLKKILYQKIEPHFLNIQYRMHRDISSFPSYHFNQRILCEKGEDQSYGF